MTKNLLAGLVLIVMSMTADAQIKTLNGRTFSKADLDLFLENQVGTNGLPGLSIGKNNLVDPVQTNL